MGLDEVVALWSGRAAVMLALLAAAIELIPSFSEALVTHISRISRFARNTSIQAQIKRTIQHAPGILALLAAVASYVAFDYSNRVGTAKDAVNLELARQVAVLQKEAADARTRQADAETRQNATSIELAEAEARLNATVIEVDHGKLQLAEVEKKTAEANLAVENARAETAKVQLEVIKRTAGMEMRIQWLIRTGWPRTDFFNHTDFVTALKGSPKGRVTIFYPSDDREAHGLGIRISGALNDAGWNSAEPLEIPKDQIFARLGGQPWGVTLVSRLGGHVTNTIGTNNQEVDDPFIRTLCKAIQASLHQSCAAGTDSTLEDGDIRIVVGGNPWKMFQEADKRRDAEQARKQTNK